MATWTVGTYWINFYAGPGPTRAIVMLFEDNGGPNTARAYFVDSGPISANATRSPNITIHYPLAALEPFLTMLREEKPVYVNVWSASSVAVSTSQEPVGEGEGT